MSSLKKTVGENIRFERIARNMSLDELAEIIEITPGFLGLIERGKRGTDLSNLVKIAEIFGVTLDSLTVKYTDHTNKVAESKRSDLKSKKRSAISTILYDLNESELDFIISIIKNLKQMKASEIFLDNQETVQDQNNDINSAKDASDEKFAKKSKKSKKTNPKKY